MVTASATTIVTPSTPPMYSHGSSGQSTRPTCPVAAATPTIVPSNAVPTATFTAPAAYTSPTATVIRALNADWSADAAPAATTNTTSAGANDPTGRPICDTTTATMASMAA